jgi:ribonuclease HII
MQQYKQKDLKMTAPQLIIGVDEAGRGPLAGPVVAAAVILDPNHPIAGINDSKLLSEKKREALSLAIKHHALCYCIGMASVEEIDSINILQATFLAMQRAVQGLTLKADVVWVDGRDKPDFGLPTLAIIGGDALHQEIGAASILAKVARDEIMVKYGQQFPNYGFEQHKGYGTKVHLEALSKFGVLNIHRKSFAPVRNQLALQETSLA